VLPDVVIEGIVCPLKTAPGMVDRSLKREELLLRRHPDSALQAQACGVECTSGVSVFPLKSCSLVTDHRREFGARRMPGGKRQITLER
jgi:hypothetical protein